MMTLGYLVLACAISAELVREALQMRRVKLRFAQTDAIV
jgi:hypothetical protein